MAVTVTVKLAMMFVLAGILSVPGLARADVCTGDAGVCADVLAQEARWLTAITGGDRGTVESILSPNFRHITSDGVLLDRAAEIASTKPLLVTMTATEQIVDTAADTAVIHGLNTVSNAAGVVQRVRFTDVFIFQDGTWMALSAQETSI